MLFWVSELPLEIAFSGSPLLPLLPASLKFTAVKSTAMNRLICSLLLLSAWASCFVSNSVSAESPPNIVFMMSDELAYYELSHMGNPKIKTPHIDQMAREGIRFTQALAAAPVCAPLRAALMTGKHMGHASVRANDGGTPLRADEITLARALKSRGYATGGFGKWGAGGRGSTGVPEKHGFDVFYGYYDQVHAHSFFPAYLIRNSEEVVLPGNQGGRSGETYSHYSIMEEAFSFIRENRDRPFFCYLPITPPHGMYDIPSDDPAWDRYQHADWMQSPEVSQDAKNYAAMVSMVDNNLGELVELLRELDLEDNTIVFFTGDNGGQDRFKGPEFPRGYFGPNVDPVTGVELRGQKGNLYEGGLRIPFLARWPGNIQAGTVSDLLFNQVDVFPTLAELAQVDPPEDLDGMSILPELLGSERVGREQATHEYLYWEFGQQIAVRKGHWKAIRPKLNADWELYDLRQDPSEKNDVASHHVALLKGMQEYAAREHTPVRPGSYVSRVEHEKDRQAKWGSTRPVSSGKSPARRLDHKLLLPPKSLKLHGFSSENRANDRLAVFAIDGNPNTIWHSQFSPTLVQGPHELIIDVGSQIELSGIQYLARQDGGWNGTFGDIEVRVSEGKADKGQLVAQVSLRKEKKPQNVLFERPRRGRFVRIKVLSEVNRGPWASAADIGILKAK